MICRHTYYAAEVYKCLYWGYTIRCWQVWQLCVKSMHLWQHRVKCERSRATPTVCPAPTSELTKKSDTAVVFVC